MTNCMTGTVVDEHTRDCQQRWHPTTVVGMEHAVENAVQTETVRVIRNDRHYTIQ